MKYALVIGSTGGIGSAICRRMLSSGWYVFGADIKGKSDSSLEQKGHYQAIDIDITDKGSIDRSCEVVAKETETLQAIVIASGTYDHFPLAEADPERLERLIDVNVVGPAMIVPAFFNMLRSRESRVVFISSETALVSLPFQVYGVSKRMLEAYIDALRQELALIHIPAITVRPGAHSTGLLQYSREALSDFPAYSRFSKYLARVRDRGQAIIDQGADDPDHVARAVLKALNSPRPGKYYHVNVSSRFNLMARLPEGLRELILRMVLR